MKEKKNSFLGVRIPEKLKRKVKAKAESERRSMSKTVQTCLEAAVRLDVAGDEIKGN